MTIDDIPLTVLDALHQLGHDDAAILRMPPEKMFDEFCTWNGLIGWSRTLWCVVNTLKELESEQ